MRKLGIARVVIGLLIVIAISCPMVFADQDQGDLLTAAACAGNLKRVQELLDQGVDANAKDKDGVTALWKVALGDHGEKSRANVKVAKLLLDKGADPNVKDKIGRTALMWASVNGQVDFVRLLLDKGADANDRNSLPKAAQHLEVVKLLLEKGADANAKDSTGNTALTNATRANQAHVAKYLLDNNADPNEPDGLGWTPLMLMCSVNSGNITMVKLLLERGANINARTPSGRTALMQAAAKGYRLKGRGDGPEDRTIWPVGPPWDRHPEVVKLLLEKGAEVNAKDSDGWTALKRAQKRGDTQIVELLKAHGAKE
jgi:ankyrin repeat protein